MEYMPVALNLEQCKTKKKRKIRGRAVENGNRRIVHFYHLSALHHEAEESGEAVQGGVEELSTGLMI